VPYVYCTHVSIVSVHSNPTYLLAYMKAIVITVINKGLLSRALLVHLL